MNPKTAKALENRCVAIVGIGTLGTVVSEQLARAGVGRLILVDRDAVESKNLRLQKLFGEADVNKPKASVAKEKLTRINPDVKIDALQMNLTSENVEKIKSDAIVDCTDNFETRFLINDFSKKNSVPFVHGAAAGAFGNVLNVLPEGVCFQCIFKESEMDCSSDGIEDSVAKLVGEIQAEEAIKILLEKNPETRLIRVNVLNDSIEKISVKKSERCDACRGRFIYLDAEQKESPLFKIERCRTIAAFTVKPLRRTKLNLDKIKKRFRVVKDTPIAIVVDGGKDIGEIVVHDYGELTFRKASDKNKIEKIAREIYGAEA